MKKETLYKELIKAYKEDDYSEARTLMDGYSPAQVRAAYKAIEEVEGYTTLCQVKQGNPSRMSKFLGV